MTSTSSRVILSKRHDRTASQTETVSKETGELFEVMGNVTGLRGTFCDFACLRYDHRLRNEAFHMQNSG
jgi:hypothetical protein